MKLKEYISNNKEVLLYKGNPDPQLLATLAEGPGDVWHSSLDQGYRGIFPELKYQIAVFWWFLNDFEDLERSISWRINPSAFVIRKKVWDIYGGFPGDYDSEIMKALDLGFRMLRYCGGVTMYVKDLYQPEENHVQIPNSDKYLFFLKNFKKEHAYNMLLKKGVKQPLQEFYAFKKASALDYQQNDLPLIPPRELEQLKASPSVSVIIPTMSRQNYTLQLLKDYREQSYPVKEIIIVDATPAEDREENLYTTDDYGFELQVIWQKSKGSCRARNEAIKLCSGDYIIFADDDTRIPWDFVENHLRLLQTYKVDACNGLDIQAGNPTQDLNDLKKALDALGESRWKVGAAQTFSNANSCVKTSLVNELIGNDINFDGGYGEDSDFGFSIFQAGYIALHNPFSVNLHLKPSSGGYRHWGLQSAVIGKKRKKQAWEMDEPVKFIRPVPSPTIMYGILKRFKDDQIREYRSRYFLLYLMRKPLKNLPFRLINLPYKILQFNRSMFYARKLNDLGERFE